MLTTDYTHGKEEEKVLNMIEKSAHNALKLINELLEINGREEGGVILNKQVVEVNEFIRQATALMSLNAEKKLQKIQLVLLPNLLNINIDTEKIERVIHNLLDNAIKFSPNGNNIKVKLEQKENAIIIAIKDKGIGIPGEIQSEIFNTSGSTRREGTAGERSFGLGLSICKQIIEAHNGKIWIESKPGTGTDCYIELPLT